MAPRKTKETTATATAVDLSPRRLRSAAAGKRTAPPPPTKATMKKKATKKVRFGNEPVEKKEELKNKTIEPETGEINGEHKTGEEGGKMIVIEACKQCNSFKTRALKVKEGLETAISSISVTINPEKPRRGCFEIREEGGQVFISLLDMKRPFTPMKELDMDQVIKDIIEKIE